MIDVRTTPAPIETITPIKPSEAIRLGCIVAPVQSFGDYGEGETACVIGALNLGYGRNQEPADDTDPTGIPLMVEMGAICPDTGAPLVRCHGSWASVPFHLNDDHRWSRERIADWLESLGL